MTKKEPTNPFYSLLVVAGVLFTLTACAYGVLAVRGVRADRGEELAAAPHGLMKFLDQHGVWLLMGEVAVLAILTFAAMATDDYWAKRAAANPEKEHPPQSLS